MKMIKKTSILLPILLLLMGQEAWAEKIAQVMVTTDKTMYFVYDEPITVGNTYQSKTVSRVWSGDDVINSVLLGLSKCSAKTNLILCMRRGMDYSYNKKVLDF